MYKIEFTGFWHQEKCENPFWNQPGPIPWTLDTLALLSHPLNDFYDSLSIFLEHFQSKEVASKILEASFKGPNKRGVYPLVRIVEVQNVHARPAPVCSAERIDGRQS